MRYDGALLSAEIGSISQVKKVDFKRNIFFFQENIKVGPNMCHFLASYWTMFQKLAKKLVGQRTFQVKYSLEGHLAQIQMLFYPIGVKHSHVLPT